jgi:hypothetical protein
MREEETKSNDLESIWNQSGLGIDPEPFRAEPAIKWTAFPSMIR